MIQIVKPDQSPEILTCEETADFITSEGNKVVALLNDYLTGVLKVDMPDSKIYGHSTVKSILMTAQHGKCCYCERGRDSVELDTEHFRPKGAVKQSRSNRTIMYPGYYWLAYDWRNLYLSCKKCNTSWKQVYFPISNQPQRSRWHGDPNLVINEIALLVSPGEDARLHIRFKETVPYWLTEKGQTTIEHLGLLDRVELKEARLEHFRQLKHHYNMIKLLRFAEENNIREMIESIQRICDIDEVKEYLRRAILPTAEFSSMAIDYLNEYQEDT